MPAFTSRSPSTPVSSSRTARDAESFVSRMRRAERAISLAQAQCAQHHYSEAARLLAPWRDDVPGPLEGIVFELLGQCALHGAGDNWAHAFARAIGSYEQTGDELGLARVLLHRGEAQAARGDFVGGIASVRRAGTFFVRHDACLEKSQSAMVEARILLSQNKPASAEALLDTAVHATQEAGASTQEALARLLRAQVFGSLNEPPRAARDLLFSERISERTSAGGKVRIALARAESLLWLGYPYRAWHALEPLAGAVEARDELGVSAHYARLCGESQMEAQPRRAAHYLTQAVRLFSRLGQTYFQAQAELKLAVAEQRQGMDARSRFLALEKLNLSRWPVLADDVARHRAAGPRGPSAFAQQAQGTVRLSDLPEVQPIMQPDRYRQSGLIARLSRWFRQAWRGAPAAPEVIAGKERAAAAPGMVSAGTPASTASGASWPQQLSRMRARSPHHAAQTTAH